MGYVKKSIEKPKNGKNRTISNAEIGSDYPVYYYGGKRGGGMSEGSIGPVPEWIFTWVKNKT